MTLSFKQIVQLFTFSILSASVFFTEAEAVTPAVAPLHEVQVENELPTSYIPAWKNIWDNARKKARAKEFEESKAAYLRLFEVKPNITEARWEYCKLLISLKEYESVSRVLESLIELEPNNLEYLVHAGEVALKNERYRRAVKYFGQVYEADPGGYYSSKAIKGLIGGFKGQGNLKSAFLLMEQYYQRDKEDKNNLLDLAGLSKKLGQLEKSRFYYSSLVDNFAVRAETILEAALAHDVPGLEEKAINYWKKYLLYYEDYLPAHRNIAKYYTQLNKPKLALSHLIKIYTTDSLSTELALQIADIYYLNLSRPDKGLFYYEQYSSVFPHNKKIINRIKSIRTHLADSFLSIVENDGALQLWQDLEHITIKKEGIFLEMAEILGKQGKIDQEIGIVKILFDNNRDDLDLGFRLAKLHFLKGNYSTTLDILGYLENSFYGDVQYHLLKAETEIKIGNEQKGLLSMIKYLSVRPGDLETTSTALELSGTLGLVRELHEIWTIYSTNLNALSLSIDLGLTYIEALRKNGLYSTCDVIYGSILDNIGKDDLLNISKVQFHRADSLYQQGLVFEAEQIVRQVLARNVSVNQALEKLTRLSIDENQIMWAESWLYLLAARYNIFDIEEEYFEIPESIQFFYLDLLLAKEEYDEVEERILEQIGLLEVTGVTRSARYIEKSKIILARTYFYSGRYDKCFATVVELLENNSDNYELRALAEITADELEIDLQSEDAVRMIVQKRMGFSDYYQKAIFYEQYGKLSHSLQAIKNAQRIIGDSVSAHLVEVTILSSLSKFTQALDIMSDLVSSYPDQYYFNRLQLQLEFQSGNFRKIVKKVPIKETTPVALNDSDNEIKKDLYFRERLLLARSLWAENRRDEAIKVYDSLLAISVDSVFLEKVEVESVNFRLPPLKKSFWNVITFTSPSEPDPITTVMDPQFFTKNIGQPVDDIAAGLYGKYRWQKLIKKELAARQAIENRDFYQAEKEYRSLIKEEKSQETLFDLANIYSRFGEYGKEAEMYEMMKKEGPLYPGLDESIESNSLRRQPRISSTFSTLTSKGRDGYKNMRKRVYGFEGWLMPSLDQELSLGIFRNDYRSNDNKRKSESNRFIGTYSTYFEDTFDLNISVGSDNPTDSGTSEMLLKFEIIGRFNDFLQGYGRFEQDLVEDTVRAISDSVVYRDLDTGLKIDLYPRWFMGADYRYRLYSDDNIQNRFKLWSMYHLFGENNQFKLKYSYENIHNSSENLGRDKISFHGILANEFDNNDRVYWSPKSYWEHLFTFHFKHIFINDFDPKSTLSYCSFDYSYGYDEYHDQSHSFDINIFLEINRHFLLKGNFNNQNGEEYNETEALLSLIYRW